MRFIEVVMQHTVSETEPVSKGTVIGVKQLTSRLKTYAVRAVMMCAIFMVVVAAGKTIKIIKETKGREGPGSYFKLVAVIPSGTTIEVAEEKENWFKVTYEKQVMWISGNSVAQAKGKAADKGPGRTTPFREVSSNASPAVLTAAIKGFWTRYSRNTGDLYELPVDGYDLSPAGYEAFAGNRSREVNRPALMKKYRLKNKYKDYDIPAKREMSVGYACASAAAVAPPIDDEAPVGYVHHVGWYIASATERYDMQYTFYILDTDQINAISCPGGYIVLTRGLLTLLGDESELAALLAHEMAHVVAGHGMIEAIEDKTRIKADSAFDALNKEVGESAVEAELIGVTDRAMAIARSPKLDQYEFEADELALLYMARCGYDLEGLPRLLQKLKAVHDRNTDIFDLNYRNHPDFGGRMKRIGDEMKDYKNYSGKRFESDFSANMKF